MAIFVGFRMQGGKHFIESNFIEAKTQASAKKMIAQLERRPEVISIWVGTMKRVK